MFKAIFFSALALLFVTSFVGAQTAIAEGSLSGTVVDPQGARIATATVTIEKKGFARTLSANEVGEFTVQLSPGKYRITAEAMGFHKYRRKIVIGNARTESLHIKLDVIVQKFKCPPGHICL
jgi:uncharacterized membrane protein